MLAVPIFDLGFAISGILTIYTILYIVYIIYHFVDNKSVSGIRQIFVILLCQILLLMLNLFQLDELIYTKIAYTVILLIGYESGTFYLIYKKIRSLEMSPGVNILINSIFGIILYIWVGDVDQKFTTFYYNEFLTILSLIIVTGCTILMKSVNISDVYSSKKNILFFALFKRMNISYFVISVATIMLIKLPLYNELFWLTICIGLAYNAILLYHGLIGGDSK